MPRIGTSSVRIWAFFGWSSARQHWFRFCTDRSNSLGAWISRSPKPSATWSTCAVSSPRRRSPFERRRRGSGRSARPTCCARWASSGCSACSCPRSGAGSGCRPSASSPRSNSSGQADQSVAAAFQAHVTIGSMPLYLFGNDEQRERWLRPLAEGRVLGAFGLTEPDAGSDMRGITTRAEQPGRRLADQRPQGVHLQRRHRHVVRRHAAGPHRDRR